MLVNAGFEMAQQIAELLLLAFGQTTKQLNHPLLMV
jgi:hypothetical protein